MRILRTVTGIMRIQGQIIELSVNGRVIRIMRILRSVNGTVFRIMRILRSDNWTVFRIMRILR